MLTRDERSKKLVQPRIELETLCVHKCETQIITTRPLNLCKDLRCFKADLSFFAKFAWNSYNVSHHSISTEANAKIGSW